VQCNFLWTEATFDCQDPKDTSSFSQVLMHTYSDNIYLSLMADRRLGGLYVVQEQYLTYRQFPATMMWVLYGSDTVKLLLGIDYKVWGKAYRVFPGGGSRCEA
jgi:hypothetical protein